jgi:leucyl aminopeptidase
MKIKILSRKQFKPTDAPLAVFAHEDDKSSDAYRTLAAEDGFKGKSGQSIVVRPSDGKPAKRVLLVGLGKKSEFSGDILRRGAASVVRTAERLELADVGVEAATVSNPVELQSLFEGLLLGSYRFDRHKSAPKEPLKRLESTTVLVDDAQATVADDALKRARVYANGTILARDLINEPPSRMNPARLAEEALKLNKAPISVKVIEGKELEKLGMGGIIGVGSGGAVPPRLVELIYKPAKKAKRIVALVGKGITFDSGGLSLKPAQSMETMKDDMSGAAAVLGIFSALPSVKPDLEVRGYLAIAENMPGGGAQKPGDVLKAFNGKTIEVLNTDAEGRLVLADALSYAGSKKPDILIDIATLTGAAVVALGHLVAAVMSPSKKLVQDLIAAGDRAGEKFWELPLVKEYQPDIKSKIADVKNIGGRRGESGTIIGGLFLQEFVDGVEWAHIDIAGPSWTDHDSSYCPTGGTGFPVRTILHYLETLNG